ncbi:MAG: hypothetical protein JWQ29_1100 [Phenylobacterium sp.]|nr:hypothetical protein [Phenylobacterium sp.]
MPETLATLAEATLARNGAFAGRVAQNPLRALALEWLRRRNTALDAVFYDVGVITAAETQALAPWLAHEGAIVVTPPSGGAPLTVYEDLDKFLASPHRQSVHTLAVAGVGSSALGGAALARNIADARDETVAAVVSGYGFADLPTEALGGWICFGALNSVRHAFEGLDRWSRLFEAGEKAIEVLDGVGLARLSKDTATLTRLLGDPGFKPKLLVGHSKGNLVISEALYWLAERDLARCTALGQDCNIVTLCAKIGMPPAFERVIDVTGELDGFGAMNSRQDIVSEYVAPHAWHSTNREFPFGLGLDVAAALRHIEPLLAAPRPNRQPGPLAPLPDAPQKAAALLPR